jgi:multicomponent Na+:H+ antiporter subunit D
MLVQAMNLLILPVLLPLLGGAGLLVLRRRRSRLVLAVLTSCLTLAVTGVIAWRVFSGEVLSVQMSGWQAPFGISLVVDGLSALLLLLSAVVGLLTVIFADAALQAAPRRGYPSLLNRARELFGTQALFQFLFMGVNMSFVTGDLFNLFVAFEVMLISSYGLLLIGGELPQLREGLKYVVINLVSSAMFVAAAGLAYGLFGTLNMADIGQRAALHGPDPRITAIALLLAFVFATKSAVFPFGFWLPNAYPVPMAATSAFFAAMLTKVGAYALIRLFTLLFPGEVMAQQLLLGLAGVTVVIAALGAVARHRWRHILSFANVASIAYVVMGAFSGNASGQTAAVYYLVNSVLVIFAVFLIAALAEKLSGQSTLVGGHLSVYPWLGTGFFITMLAVAGMPPTSGFIGKFALVTALFETGGVLASLVAACAIIAGFLLLYAGIQVWRGYFWGDPGAVKKHRLPRTMVVVATASVCLVGALAAASGPVYKLAGSVAQQLGSNAGYLAAVFPDGNPTLDEE